MSSEHEPTTSEPRTARITARALVLIVLGATVPYLGILHAPFVFDDVKLVQQNEYLDLGWDRLGELVGTFNVFSERWADEELRPNYRPLRFLSYYVDFQLSRLVWGDFPATEVPPFFFHVTNIVLHAFNALLVFALTRRLARTLSPARDGTVAALFAALLFAVHPLQTEAVTYVSGRRDVLSTFFYLAAVAIYAAPRLRARVTPLAALALPALVLAGLLSKEMAATLPAALVLLDLVLRSRWGAGRVLLHAANFAIVAVHVGLTLERARVVAAPPEGATGTAVILMACRYAQRYLALLLFPSSQSVDYSYDAIPLSDGLLSPPTTLVAVLATLALLTVAAAGLVRPRWGGWLALGLLWFFGTLVPVLQFVPIPERFAERFAYLPGLGIVLIAAAGLARLHAANRLLGGAAATVVCGVLVLATVVRNDAWTTPLRLWTAAVEAQPRCARAHLARANWLKQGGRHREAEEAYTRALEIFSEAPDLPLHHGYTLQALAFRAEVRGTLGREDEDLVAEAIADYRRLLGERDIDGTAIAGSAKHTLVHFNLAGVLLLDGQTEEARAEYRRVLEIGEPAALVAASHYYLGKLALAGGDPEGALASYRRALAATPGEDPAFVAVAVELAELLITRDALDEAWRVLEDASARVSGRAQLHLLMRQAKVLDRRGEVSATIDLLEEILARDPGYFAAAITLADIHAGRNEFEAAGMLYAEVLRRDPMNEEARRGLQSVAIRRSAAESEKDPRARTRAELDALLEKGSAQVAAGEFIAAVKVYERLLEKAHAAEARDVELSACRELARLVEHLGRHQLAEEYLLRSLDLESRDPEIHRRLGDLRLRHLDLPEKARADYERYLDLVGPGGAPEPYVLFNLALLLAAEAPGRALDLAQRAAAAGLDDRRLDRTLGELHVAVGDWEEALDAFNRYLERLPPGKDEEERAAVRELVREKVLPRLLEEDRGGDGDGARR